MSNNLKYASREDLPPGDNECAICQETVYVGRNPEGVVDCVICSTCGKRMHKTCNNRREFEDRTNCPSCRGKNTVHFCTPGNNKYYYVERKGGKRRRTHRRRSNRRKTKRRKTKRMF